MSHRFKVGDRVRTACDGGFGSKYKGQLGTVMAVRKFLGKARMYLIKLDNIKSTSDLCYIANELEPAPGSAVDLPLEDLSSQELVDIANTGIEAARVLGKRQDAEFHNTYHNEWRDLRFRDAIVLTSVRLKPKPEFKPYTIKSTGWEVSYDIGSNTVKIGCKTLELPLLKAVLKCLLDGDSDYITTPEHSVPVKFKAVRRGIKYYENTLPWADAEELYEKIKEL